MKVVCLLITTALAISVSGFVVEDVSYMQSLFQKTNDMNVGVTPADAARLVARQIDESDLQMIINDTVPKSTNISILFSQQHLNAETIMERMKPVIHQAVQECLTSSDAMYTPEEVTLAIVREVTPLLNNGVNERRKFLDQKRETHLNKIVQSMINDMWAITTDTIRDSSLDTYNIDISSYNLMLQELIPKLIESTDYADVGKVLAYPVIKDELNIIIRKSKVQGRQFVSGSVQELTDKIFMKLVPFMREGVLMTVKKIELWTPEDSLQQISDVFGPKLKMATKEGLVYAAKLQAALKQEMADHLVTTSLIEMVEPLVETGVMNVMNKLKSRGFSAPGVVKDWILKRYITFNIQGDTGKSIYSGSVYNELSKSFQKLIDSAKPLPSSLDVLDQFQKVIINPKINELMMENIDDFRRQHPQFTQCGANILAATVVGSMKANIKSLTRQYLENMASSPDVTDDQAAIDYVFSMVNESLPKKIEEEAEEQRDFDSGMFLDSDAFDDVNVRIESSISSIVIKELQNLRQPQED